MKYRVTVLRRAQDDVARIFDWLSCRSRRGAHRWYSAFEAAAADLSQSPLAHAIAPESEHFSERVRERFFKTRHGRVYRILFTVVKTEVHIHRVRGPGQQPVQHDEIADIV